MSSSEMLRAAAATGSTCTRTANFCAPNTSTWATPGICEICCASVISPNSSTTDKGKVGETRLIYMIGKSPGFTLRKLGGVVISTGSLRAATVSAADVAVELELDRDRGDAERRRRGERGDAGDGGKLALDRRRHRCRHGFRACARQLSLDADGRKVDGR